MKNLLIIGARGYGREVYYLAKDCQQAGLDFSIKGFLDDKHDALAGLNGYPPVISPVECYIPENNDVFVCALGNPAAREKYANIIMEKGGGFISLIHPQSIVRESSRIGHGCLIHAHCIVSTEVVVGNFVVIHPYAILGHDCQVSDWCHIGASAFMGGSASLEPGVQLGPGSHILPGLTVGADSVVGSGSVVLRNVKKGTSVFGNPAQKISF